MCSCGYGYFDPGAFVIAELNEGDEINLQKGFGYPETNDDTTKIILMVDIFSAVCTDGTVLNCHDGNGVTKTGRNLPIEPSLKIYIVKGKIFLRRSRSSLLRSISNFGDRIWYFQYRLKKKIKNIFK